MSKPFICISLKCVKFDECKGVMWKKCFKRARKVTNNESQTHEKSDNEQLNKMSLVS